MDLQHTAPSLSERFWNWLLGPPFQPRSITPRAFEEEIEVRDFGEHPNPLGGGTCRGLALKRESRPCGGGLEVTWQCEVCKLLRFEKEL